MGFKVRGVGEKGSSTLPGAYTVSSSSSPSLLIQKGSEGE